MGILPAGTKSNIVISVKAATAQATDQPAQVVFASDETPEPLPQSVASATLPPTDTDSRRRRLTRMQPQ